MPALAQADAAQAAPPASPTPAPPTAPAQDAASAAAATQEVVVTATKRPLTLQAVPAAVSVVGSAQLAENHIEQPQDLNGEVPGLQIRANNNEVSLFLRGVGHSPYSPQAENSVALNVDGVYMSRTSEGLGAFFDVSRVEVLNGPQGTLYGRNATGGVVNVITNTPTMDNESYVSVGGGNYARVDGEAVFSGPITDNAQLRIGAYEHHRDDGFGTDRYTNTPNDNLDEHGTRATLKLEPTDRLQLYLRGDGYFAKDHDAGYFYDGPSGRQPETLLQNIGGLIPPGKFDNYANVDGARQVLLAGTSLETDYRLTNEINLKSLTAYRYNYSFYQTDIDGTQLNESYLDYRQSAEHYSEELSGNYHQGPLYASLGFYYFGELNRSRLYEPQPLYFAFTARGVPIPRTIERAPGATGIFEQIGTGRTNAEAVYGNVSYQLTSKLNLGVGLRYSTEDKENSGRQQAVVTPFAPFTGVRNSNGLTPAFTAAYKLTGDTNLYATISRGFKSGEWIAGTPQYARPESVWDYEAGVKGEYFDRRLQVSLGGFYYDYKDLQVEILQGGAAILINAPTATLYGLEGSGNLSLPYRFDLHGSFSALHTEFGNLYSADPNIPGSPVVDLRGNELPNAPPYQVAAGLSKHLDYGRYGTGVATVDYSWQDRAYLDIYNVTDNNYRPAYSMVNLSYTHVFPDRHLSLLVYGRNLNNAIVISAESVSSAYNQRLVNYTEPRTYGATLKYNF